MFRATCLPFFCGISICPKAVLFSREDGPGETKGKQEFLLKRKYKHELCIYKKRKPAFSKINERVHPIFLRKEDLKVNPFIIAES